MFTVKEIMEITAGELLAGDQNTVITSVHFDSRQIKEGALFVALTSGARDGHDFLVNAAAGGAVAAFVSDRAKALSAGLPSTFALICVKDTEKAFQQIARIYRNRLTIPIAAITGSNGKTTTKDILAHLLSGQKKVYKTYKNFNNHLGVPLSLLQITPDTEAAVLELGMNHAGEIDFLAGIVRPTYSVITNVNDAHMEFFESKEMIAKAKGEILGHTDPDGFACLNQDNELVANLAHLNPGKTYFYHVQRAGEKSCTADITASNLSFDENGSRFVVTMNGGEPFECFMPLFGEHNISNALPAIFIAMHLGISRDEIIKQLATLTISAMRFERLEGANGLLVINDAYNASPSSMVASVETFLSIYPDRKKVLILGDMFELGAQSEAYHHEVGKKLKELDKEFELVAIGKDAKHLAKGYGPEARYFVDKDEAAAYLERFKSNNYAVLLKASRGMHLETLLDILC
ncbi:UDP-N-acetylmuramoyl-tripeptide--D-alanyl-D-alanine ligase [Aneurinibacillus thermoaerophilus]|uniref:UDP-N-acetylmuramoyl-tripeptide--D-alanyl-D-alanine ligase n=1 Tax=Aneurinibacillus thermoaerophilus TaxID=143495 RepID=A0ABX8Y8B6_ANETH|nr:UDP-N-acetylmuramoyl-tripeptide--D-alanyl-D-alanine ligase [Aneurinibacillus thermoaerophilus]QYY41892.1 UDP-N-acetylmuramoyl-tripeptide--D-alanyl-D-alanine ligase [Aneurinibacillus thermoaerophilus]